MFFAFVVLTMAAIVSAVLFLTSTLSLRDSGGRLVFDNELRHLAASTERRMGHLSAMAIRMGHPVAQHRTLSGGAGSDDGRPASAARASEADPGEPV